MEKYKFFNSTLNDVREYQASDFADYFGTVLSTGLVSVDDTLGLKVSHVENLMLSVAPGKAVFKGHMYENTSNLNLDLAFPETDLDRIDRIVLRLDLSNEERNIKLAIKKGTPAESPTPPTLTRDEFMHELSLAQVFLTRNTSSVTSNDITDERLDENLCGLTSSLISVPTSQFLDDWNNWFTATKDNIDSVSSTELQELQSIIDKAQSDWDAWFETQQNQSYISQANFDQHTSDQTAHGIGDRSLLETTDKTTIVNAVNELFTDVSNGKVSVRDAITGKDGTVTDNNGDGVPTFTELVSGVNSIPQAKGNALASDVLTGHTFSSENAGIEVSGTMPNRGSVSHSLPVNGSYTIPSGYHTGSGKVTQSIPTRGASTITPGTSNKTIASGQYLTGTQTIAGDADLIASNIRNGKNIFGVVGSLVEGKQFASGSAVSILGSYNQYFYETDGDRIERPAIIVVTGLTFEPSIIIGLQGNRLSFIYNKSSQTNPNRWLITVVDGFTSYKWDVGLGHSYVNSTGFKFPSDSSLSRNASSSVKTGLTYDWIAIE